MQGGRGRGRRGGFLDSGLMGEGNGLAFGFDAGVLLSTHASVLIVITLGLHAWRLPPRM